MSTIDSYAAVRGVSGLIDVFTAELPADGKLASFSQARLTSGGWTPWEDAGFLEGAPGELMPVADPAGPGHVLVSTVTSGVWFNEREADDEFTGWQPFGHPPSLTLGPACGAIRDGWLDIFVLANSIGGESGPQVWTISRGTPAVSPWKSLGHVEFGGGLAAVAAVGHLDVVVGLLDGQHELSHRRRQPDGSWTPWAVLPMPFDGLAEVAPSLVLDAFGLTRLFAVTVSGAVVRNRINGSGQWEGWRSLDRPKVNGAEVPVTEIVVALDAGRRLVVCATLADHTMAERREGPPAQGWQPWRHLGNNFTSEIDQPAALVDGAGRLHFFTRRAAGAGVVFLVQDTPNGPWRTGIELPARPGD